jgi:predicted SAM-dependent methyltransferase
MKLLNLGCGQRYHAAWTNVDMVARPPAVIGADLRRPLPFGADEFSAVYHSHVLEHFHPQDGARLLAECHRVIKPGGCLRVAVPDLERIARDYLEALAATRAQLPGAPARYAWMRLELFDQMTRETSGGRMHRHLLSAEADHAFITQRMGVAGAQMLTSARRQHAGSPAPAPWRAWFWRATHVRTWRGLFTRWLLGPRAALLDLGRFRRGGEIHLQMYDSHSLGAALTEAGFIQPRACSAHESSIPGWLDFHLDTEPDGSIYKADSLYMEARKS